LFQPLFAPRSATSVSEARVAPAGGLHHGASLETAKQAEALLKGDSDTAYFMNCIGRRGRRVSGLE
jgi:hypothetical protein